MKAYCLVFLVFALLSVPATAQKIAPAAVPKPVSDLFIKAFPGVMADWELKNGQYIATFEQDKYNMQTVYSPDGKRLETRVTIAQKELPEPILEYISHYSPTIDGATKIIMANDQVSFKVLTGSQYMLFDVKGNYLSTVSK